MENDAKIKVAACRDSFFGKEAEIVGPARLCYRIDMDVPEAEAVADHSALRITSRCA